MTSSHEKYELPEILYDEPEKGKIANQFPFINVKKDGKMPPVIFIEERKNTGEIEPGLNGTSQEIVDCLMHKFVDLEVLKEKLPPHLNDLVRVSLGMKPLKEAQGSGQKILDQAMENAKKIKENMEKKASLLKNKKEKK